MSDEMKFIAAYKNSCFVRLLKLGQWSRPHDNVSGTSK